MDELVEMKKSELDNHIKSQVEKGVQDTLRKSTSAGNGIVNIKIGTDRNEPVVKAKHIGKMLLGITDRDHKVLDDLKKEAPQFYTQKAYGTEGTSGQGGYLVPTFWSDEIANTAEQYGFARALAKRYPMQSNIAYFNRGGSVTGGMVAEESAPTPTDASTFFAQTTLTAKRAAAAFLTSRELLDDAQPAYMDYITKELARFMAETEDLQFFSGSGSGANLTGIKTVSGTTVVYCGGGSTSGKTAFANVSWKDLINLRLGLNTSVSANGVFVVPQTIFGYLLKEVDSNGRPIFDMNAPVNFDSTGISALNGNTYLTPTGKKMVVVPDGLFPSTGATTMCGIFTDFGQYTILGERSGLEVQTFKESYNGVALSGVNRLALEISERFGVAFPAPAAIGVLKTSTT
jgi:HK97 family phage major capsid protein